MAETFTELLKAYMVEVEHKAEEEADVLIKKYRDIVIRGCLSGNFVATAMAIDLKESGEV